MNTSNLSCLARTLLGAVLLLCSAAVAWPFVPADLKAGKPRDTTESLQPWQWFHELHKPAVQGEYADCLLPPGVLDKARLDLADLRLRDGRGREVPFALRVRHPRNVQTSLPHTEITRASGPKDGSMTLTLDLGMGHAEHNAVDIATSGTDFRRLAHIEGSDSLDRQEWDVLGKALLVHIPVEGTMVDVRRLAYPLSRFRYVRLRVFPDRNLDNDRPEIVNVAVLQSTQTSGLDVTLPAQLSVGASEPVNGVPGSMWIVDFGGLTVPCGMLSFDVADEDFVRAYRVEAFDAAGPYRLLATGEWSRRSGQDKKPLEVHLDPEATVKKLRLLVTDYRNPPLTLTAVRYRAAARQLIVELSDDLVWPLQLYFGNSKAQPANYDFARFLPDSLAQPPARAPWAAGGVQANPQYLPEPKPFTERWPWLVYVVLGMASAVLLGILVILGRKALAKEGRVAI
jgi:hypothetical protein